MQKRRRKYDIPLKKKNIDDVSVKIRNNRKMTMIWKDVLLKNKVELVPSFPLALYNSNNCKYQFVNVGVE
jgi:hypothetical protein